MTAKKVCIVLEGNISSGKSTLARSLVDRLAQLGLRAANVEEPHDAWAQTFREDPKDLIERIYSGPHPDNRNMVYQTLFTISMADKHIASADLLKTHDVLVFERSIFSQAYYFGQTYLNAGLLDALSFEALERLLKFLISHNKFPYLDGKNENVFLVMGADAESCYRWKEDRKKPNDEKISRDYLKLFDAAKTVTENGVVKTISASKSLLKNISKYYTDSPLNSLTRKLPADIVTNDAALDSLIREIAKLVKQSNNCGCPF